MRNVVRGMALLMGGAFLVAASVAGAGEVKGPGAASLVLGNGERLSVTPRSIDITCNSGDTDDFDVNDFGTTTAGLSPTVYVIVAWTGNLFGGPFGGLPVLDPVVEIRRQSDNFLIASNDDNGVGSNTISVTGLDILGGFLPLRSLDSFVFFQATTTFYIRVRGFGGTCGPYAVYIL